MRGRRVSLALSPSVSCTMRRVALFGFVNSLDDRRASRRHVSAGRGALEKKGLYFNPCRLFASSGWSKLTALTAHCVFMSLANAIVSFELISSSSSHCFHHHLAAYTANGPPLCVSLISPQSEILTGDE